MDIEQVSYTKFRMHLASFINQVTKSHLPLLITRRNYEPAYLISKEMYEYLIKQTPNKLNKDKSIRTPAVKSALQEHVQISSNSQQDLFS